MTTSQVATAVGREEVTCALVCLKTGLVLRFLSDDSALASSMVDVANASPELFGVAHDADWLSLFARFGSEGSKEFREIVLVSPEHVRVMERLPHETDVVLVAVASGVDNVGFVLSAVRRRMLELAETRESGREPAAASKIAERV